MNYFTVPEMMNFGSDLIDVVFVENPVKSSVIPSFDTTARPVVASTAQNRTHRLCDSHITIPRDVVNETTPVELDSICDLNGLIDNPVLAKYLKVLSHAYYYYSKWINYNLTDEMKRSYIQETIDAVENIKEILTGYDYVVDTTVGYDQVADLGVQMMEIMGYAVVVIVVGLLLTSTAYAELPVLGMTFGTAILLGMGTNFLLGKISFIF